MVILIVQTEIRVAEDILYFITDWTMCYLKLLMKGP